MKILQRHLMLTTALALSLAVAAPFATRAEESATVPTNPGFKSSGQINPGATLQAPSQSTDIRKIPTTAQARAALFALNDPTPVLGPQSAPQPQANAGGNDGDKKNASPQAASGGGDPTTATGGQAAVGGPMSPGASAGGANNASASGSSGGGTQQTTANQRASGDQPAAGNPQAAGKAETTGTGTAAKDTRPGPFGATGQTMPSKFSERNDTLDRVPTMAWPNRLTDQERQQIYQAVMADKSQPTLGADALKPASELSTDEALTGMHALPESLQGIALIKGLQFVKGKDKVLLITPATRTVVDEITAG